MRFLTFLIFILIAPYTTMGQSIIVEPTPVEGIEEIEFAGIDSVKHQVQFLIGTFECKKKFPEKGKDSIILMKGYWIVEGKALQIDMRMGSKWSTEIFTFSSDEKAWNVYGAESENPKLKLVYTGGREGNSFYLSQKKRESGKMASMFDRFTYINISEEGFEWQGKIEYADGSSQEYSRYIVKRISP